MRHLSSFMQNEVVLALGWTLLHSLWQGLLLAVVTGCMLLATRKSDSQKRYELLTGLFLLFIAVTGMTFARELYIAIAHPRYRPLANIAAGRSVISAFIPFTESHIVVNRSWASRLKEYFNQHAYLIVTIWFIIFMARFIKLIAELAYIQRLKTYRTSEPPQAWKNRLHDLMDKMGIKVYVQLLESGLVKVPVVMGILKPVILLPFGLLSQLPPDEIEAILLHELAHIRRRDYFVNLLQSFAETLFFFNPALMWLSSLIREERENCCDDIAIAVTNNKTKYIDALISFQEFNLTKPSFTMGFPGKKYQLLNRVKRILNKRNTTLNTTEKSILTLSIATLIMLSFVAAKSIPMAKIRKRIAEHNAAATPANNDIAQKSTFNFQPREKAEIIGSFGMSTGYQPVFHDGVIDTVPVPPQEMHASNSVQNDTAFHFKHYSTDVSSDGKVNTLIINAVQQNGTTYRLKKIADRVIEFSINNWQVNEADFAKYEDQIAAVERPYLYKLSKVELDKQRAQLLHEWDLTRENLAALNKEVSLKDKNRTVRMKVIDGQWKVIDDTLSKLDILNKQKDMEVTSINTDKKFTVKVLDAKWLTQLEYLNKQEELNKKIAELDKIMLEGEEKRKYLPYFKTINLDTPRFKSQTLLKSEKINTSSKHITLSKLDVKRKSEADSLQRKADALKRELSKTQNKLSNLKKLDPVKTQNLKPTNTIISLPENFYVGVPNILPEDFTNLLNKGFSLSVEPNIDIRHIGPNYALVFRTEGDYALLIKDNGGNMAWEKKIHASKLPAPMVKLNGDNLSRDIINRQDLVDSRRLVAYLGVGNLPIFPGKINGFRATRISRSTEQESAYNYAETFGAGTINLLQKLQKGDLVLFDNITVSLLDGTTRMANPLTYKIVD